MARFIKGEVVVVPFPFSNLRNTKRRPALVITHLQGDDVILCQITSRINRKDSYSITLKNCDFQTGSLKKDSYIRPNILFTADSNIIIRKAGELSNFKTKQVIQKLISIIENKCVKW